MRPTAPLLCLLLAVPIAIAHAQAPQPQHGPDNSTSIHVPGLDILPLINLPISGEDKITWTRPIEGGGSITTYVEAKIYRDSQGRLYRERHNFTQANVDPQTTLTEFSIDDPLKHTRTTCTRASHLCQVTFYRAPSLSPSRPQPVGIFDQGRRYLSRESLGTQMIDGLSTIGTRETVTIQPGVVGNDQPLAMSREFWYAPDLQANITVTRKDPRTGTQLVQLNNLIRAEPDPSVLAVPTGYRVVDTRVLPPPQN